MVNENNTYRQEETQRDFIGESYISSNMVTLHNVLSLQDNTKEKVKKERRARSLCLHVVIYQYIKKNRLVVLFRKKEVYEKGLPQFYKKIGIGEVENSISPNL
ncbi:hypothetical protein ABEB36_012905 [Hypothenemus hampei]|uniref:Uncharacterized protein n=1 Tax=Hypothenemus hampei TaxID=57062 RepID=A0ABD1EAN1_HYPHA